ncbi:MAG TPA: hypothetical protein VN368_01455 [Candidatus Methylomirabilis sp.]|nr:hypothetical protein [Candidatus Methylomirabilis sp.]
MNSDQAHVRDSLLKRILILYGIYSLLSNAFFLAGYYLLPEGFLRGSPQMAPAEIVAQQTGFWTQFLMIIFFNMGIMIAIIVIANLNQVNGFPVGYLLPVSLGIMSGLVPGTNSFVSSDLSHYSVREGMALGLSIGGLEMFGYILIAAATVKLGVYQYRTWWRWNKEWEPTKSMDLRDVRLSRQEVLCIIAGIVLLVIAAYRETVMPLTR